MHSLTCFHLFQSRNQNRTKPPCLPEGSWAPWLIINSHLIKSLVDDIAWMSAYFSSRPLPFAPHVFLFFYFLRSFKWTVVRQIVPGKITIIQPAHPEQAHSDMSKKEEQRSWSFGEENERGWTEEEGKKVIQSPWQDFIRKQSVEKRRYRVCDIIHGSLKGYFEAWISI